MFEVVIARFHSMWHRCVLYPSCVSAVGCQTWTQVEHFAAVWWCLLYVLTLCEVWIWTCVSVHKSTAFFKVPRLCVLFLLIRAVLRWWRWVRSIGGMLLTVENRNTGENPVLCRLCSPQVLHGLASDRTQVSMFSGWQLTTWAMVRPVKLDILLKDICYLTENPVIITNTDRQYCWERFTCRT